MITIPVDIRKKYNLEQGSEIVILDIEGALTIVPIYKDFSKVQKILPTREEMQEQIEKSHREELKLEMR